MKISSKVEICNLALLKLNQNTIASIEGNDTVQAQMCRLVYEQTKQNLLSQYNWSFAIRSNLLQNVSIEAFDEVDFNEYAYAYALPSDFLRLVSLYDANNNPVIVDSPYRAKFVFENSMVKTDVCGCKIKYVANVDEVNLFPPMFIECFVLSLAMKLTKLFNDSTTYLQHITQELTITLERAKISDCQQTTMCGLSYYPLSYGATGF